MMSARSTGQQFHVNSVQLELLPLILHTKLPAGTAVSQISLKTKPATGEYLL